MTTVVVTESSSGSAPQQEPTPEPTSESPQPEPTDEALAEAVEEASETAVEIAQIEAAKDVQIAEIHAAVEVAHIEARKDTNEEIEYWRSRSMMLEAENNTLREQLAAQTTHSEPSPLEAEAVAEAETLTPTEPSSIPQSMPEEISSTVTEALVKSGGDQVEVLDLPPAVTLKRKPIIRLV